MGRGVVRVRLPHRLRRVQPGRQPQRPVEEDRAAVGGADAVDAVGLVQQAARVGLDAKRGLVSGRADLLGTQSWGTRAGSTSAEPTAFLYESWVQVTSFRPLPRLDLTILAERLNALEKAAGQWVFEGVYEVAARLWFDGGAASSIASESLVSELKLVLETQLPAWDPYGDPPEE